MTRHDRKRARARRYASRNGYFWNPCPVCGTAFGGHEWADIDGHLSTIPTGEPGSGEGICPTCTVDGVGDRANADRPWWLLDNEVEAWRARRGAA